GGSSSSRRNKELVTNQSANVAAGGNLSLLAGVSGLTPGSSTQTGHASVVGSNLASGQNLTVAASGNVNVASAQNSSYSSVKKSSSGALGLSSSSKASGKTSVTQVASNLVGQNILLDAGKSIGIAASNFIASKNINLTARDGDISVLDAANQSTSWSYKKQTGFGLGGGDGFASFYGTEGKKEQGAQSISVGSNMAAGNDITLTASRDAAIVGSGLSAGNNITINAGRDANILGGSNTSSSNKEKFASGFGVEGILGLDKTSFFLGYQQTGKGKNHDTSKNAASQIAANNNISVNAGQNVNMSGSKLTANQDLSMTAGKDINILQATETESVSAYEKRLRAGLSLTLSQNLTTNAKNAYAAGKQAVSNVEDKNVTGAGGQAYDAYSSAQALTNPKASASLTLGVGSSWSSSESHTAKAVLSELFAGRDMSLAAGRDVSMQGTQAQANRDMSIAAGRDINIYAAQSSGSSSSNSGGFEANAGIGASVSKSGYALGITSSLALNGSTGDKTSHTRDNAKLAAGEKLTTVSGQDTIVAGGNLTAKDVDMTVGRNLTVASMQNSSSSQSSSYNAGASVTVGYGADVSVTQGANLGFGFQNSNGKAVGEQTSILGGNSVNIYTENNTHVAGAIIAALNDNLKLNTGTLSYENIVGKTTETGISAGIKWKQSFTPEGEAQPATDFGESGQPGLVNQPAVKEKGSELYPEAKPWMTTLVDSQKDWQKKWINFKTNTLHNVSPDKFSYSYKETTQTAYATIGNGEITVRNTPGQSLEGLNRDPDNAMRTETTAKIDINLAPAFSYVDTALNPNTTTDILNGLNDLSVDPGSFLQRVFAGLLGGNKNKAAAKGNNSPFGSPESQKPTPAEQASQDLGSDPMTFLRKALETMFSSPDKNKPASDSGK
ncbi:MAG: hemagglutinin repeat-containing protein, partial [Desulfovibrio sp.]|uniref:hemagglutinin repeat-containing protein n=1 Tax=Desulfovibrio sp. TaxID=885 RepID=UPI0039E2411D